MKNVSILAIVLFVIGLGAGFLAGMKYQTSQTNQAVSQNRGGLNGQSRGRFGQGNVNGMRPVAGEIISADDKSITVKLSDGSSKIVLFSDNTQLNKAAVATKSDLKVGERVAVFGSLNSDGSVTAQNIQLNPQVRGGLGSPSASPR